MTSLYNSIYQIMVNNNEITNADLIEKFETDNPKTIREYASKIRRELILKQDNLESISINSLEPMIKLLNKSPNAQNLKLALDLLKAKIADKGMDDNLDISKYVLLAKSCQEDIDKSIKDIVIPDDDLTHKELAIEPEDNPWYDYDKSIELEDEE